MTFLDSLDDGNEPLNNQCIDPKLHLSYVKPCQTSLPDKNSTNDFNGNYLVTIFFFFK